MKKQPTIIGIDGGASKVRAHTIEVSENGKSFTLGEYFSVKEYQNYSDFQPDFKPVDLKTQLSQINENNIKLTEIETIQGKAYYSAFADAITEIIKSTENEIVLIGIGMPGIKSVDKRGIIAMANGPRMPNFADEIENRLLDTGIKLMLPIAKLGSDADYCGIGEEYAENGSFHDTENAYYLGGGTGTADALKLHGKLISFDECKSWIAKTWEISYSKGNSLEMYCSANGIQSVYSNFSGNSQSKLHENEIYLEQILNLANENDKAAIATWQIVSIRLAELLFERINTIYSGWQNNFSFINNNKTMLDSNHIYKSVLLDKIVIGQRLGFLFKNPLSQVLLIEPLIENLSELVYKSKSLDKNAKSHYLKSGKFDDKIIIDSQLREAPALGAGVDAFRNFKL